MVRLPRCLSGEYPPILRQFIRENLSGSCRTARGFAPRFVPTPSALVQLHFTWFAVANLRDDFHLQDRVYAGRSTDQIVASLTIDPY